MVYISTLILALQLTALHVTSGCEDTYRGHVTTHGVKSDACQVLLRIGYCNQVAVRDKCKKTCEVCTKTDLSPVELDINDVPETEIGKDPTEKEKDTTQSFYPGLLDDIPLDQGCVDFHKNCFNLATVGLCRGSETVKSKCVLSCTLFGDIKYKECSIIVDALEGKAPTEKDIEEEAFRCLEIESKDTCKRSLHFCEWGNGVCTSSVSTAYPKTCKDLPTRNTCKRLILQSYVACQKAAVDGEAFRACKRDHSCVWSRKFKPSRCTLRSERTPLMDGVMDEQDLGEPCRKYSQLNTKEICKKYGCRWAVNGGNRLCKGKIKRVP